MLIGIEKGVDFTGHEVIKHPTEAELANLKRDARPFIIVNGTNSALLDLRIGSSNYEVDDGLIDVRFDKPDVTMRQGQKLDEILRTVDIKGPEKDYFVASSSLLDPVTEQSQAIEDDKHDKDVKKDEIHSSTMLESKN